MQDDLDVPRNGYGGRVEIIEGATGRRRRSDERARIVAESLAPRDGFRCSVAARDDALAVHDWRRRAGIEGVVGDVVVRAEPGADVAYRVRVIRAVRAAL